MWLKANQQWDKGHCPSPSTQWKPDIPSFPYFTPQEMCASWGHNFYSLLAFLSLFFYSLCPSRIFSMLSPLFKASTGSLHLWLTTSALLLLYSASVHFFLLADILLSPSSHICHRPHCVVDLSVLGLSVLLHTYPILFTFQDDIQIPKKASSLPWLSQRFLLWTP